MINRKLLLVLVGGSLLISACGNNNSSSSVFSSAFSSSSSSESSISSTSSILSSEPISISITFPSITYSNALERYVNTMDTLKEYKKQIKSLYEMNIDNKNERIDAINRKYWEEYISLIEDTQNALKNEDNRRLFTDKYGEVETRYIENIDVKKIFYNRNLPHYDYDSYLALGKTIIEDISKHTTRAKILPDFAELIQSLKNTLDAYYFYNIYSDLYNNNMEYMQELSKIASAYTELNNDYKLIFKQLLNSEEYEWYTIQFFGLSDEEVNELKLTKTYSDKLVDLFIEEKELENQYGVSSIVEDQVKVYYDLVLVRQQIADELGYESYLDFVYEDKFSRDYTKEDGISLIENISKNDKLRSYYVKTKKLEMPNIIVGEEDIFNALKYVDLVVPNSTKYLKNLQTYGNYSFDVRTNKYKGSYEGLISTEGDDFVFVSTSGNVEDYSNALHEYGHYLGRNINSEDVRLDVAEIQSQGLEFIMSNYYSNFASSEATKYLIRYNLVNALWVIYSSSMISDFENKVYETKDLTITKLCSMFMDSQNNYTYPTVIGNAGFVNIPHLYKSPGYYISYLMSIIPSMELWAERNQTLAIEKYNKILQMGNETLTEALEKAEIYSPFDVRAINLIVSRIEQMA